MFEKSKNLTVKIVDGGYIFEWCDENRDEYDPYNQQWPSRKIPTSGTEVITTEKKLMERIRRFLLK